ncbi:CPBP family glutamic-type intramembrane protease [Chryseobacterium sp. POE27]|uniref:CPBP family glutamic-type intramembrane protease n=1 Tax=Chryseobacterium sp. POE27 TaxID=3138177 RepID=UPI003218F0E9
MIWGGAIAFGVWHYYNFDFNNTDIVTVIVTLLPFMINGLLLAYVVAKNGLQWSITLHMANNLWPLIIWL